MNGSYHQPPRAMDLQAPAAVYPSRQEFFAAYRRFMSSCAGTIMLCNNFSAAARGRAKTSAADRTRSPRWRAGTRRRRKMAQKARQQARRDTTWSQESSWGNGEWDTVGVTRQDA